MRTMLEKYRCVVSAVYHILYHVNWNSCFVSCIYAVAPLHAAAGLIMFTIVVVAFQTPSSAQAVHGAVSCTSKRPTLRSANAAHRPPATDTPAAGCSLEAAVHHAKPFATTLKEGRSAAAGNAVQSALICTVCLSRCPTSYFAISGRAWLN